MPDVEYLPEHPDNPHPLGRNVLWHDPANREYPIRALLGDVGVKTTPWWLRHNFDQRGSSCTAQSATGVLFSSPFRLRLNRSNLYVLDTEHERHALYLAAQAHDPWPGGEPSYEGSSTDAPFKVLRGRGLIREWRWVFGMQDLRDTLRRWGPVSVGTEWTEGMFHPDRNGYIQATGYAAGGHAWEVYWYDVDDDEYWAINSWGRRWGRNGRFRVKGAVMEELLINRRGEAATVVL